jgi:hypothetical protein
MSRLQSEFHRLYLGEPTASPADAQGRVRALVLEVVQPAGWDALELAWQGVQAELDLPAPAIAMQGVDGVQLWFSLEAPIAAPRAHAFLESLRTRYLADVPPARVRLWPDLATPPRHAAIVPALQATGNWSAFVSPDLAAVFSDTPWLDIEPGDEGQATLLRGLQSIKPAAFEAALARLDADARAARAAPLAPAPEPAHAGERTEAAPSPDITDAPRRFLLRVMNDETLDMALRIEAAKALLPR